MSVIVQKASKPYGSRMTAALLRLVTVLALMLMPLGMAGAPAMARSTPAEHAAMQMGHCDEQPGREKAPVSKMDCTAMCTALPATDAPMPAPALMPVAPRTVAAVAPFAGIEPEISTPPPKRG